MKYSASSFGTLSMESTTLDLSKLSHCKPILHTVSYPDCLVHKHSTSCSNLNHMVRSSDDLACVFTVNHHLNKINYPVFWWLLEFYHTCKCLRPYVTCFNSHSFRPYTHAVRMFCDWTGRLVTQSLVTLATSFILYFTTTRTLQTQVTFLLYSSSL